MREITAKAPIAKTKSEDKRSRCRVARRIKANIKLTLNLIHRGIVKSHTLLYSEGGHMDPWLSAFPVIVFIITILLYCLNAAGIIQLPSSWVR